jgi:positive regulator of sigma E activity
MEKEFMRETGIVINIKNNIAVVKVKRPASAGCCNLDSEQDVFIDAYNNCNANINDTVSVDSEEDLIKKHGLTQSVISLAATIAGLIAGYYISEIIGIEKLKQSFIFAIAIITVIILIFLYKKITKVKIKNSFPVIN